MFDEAFTCYAEAAIQAELARLNVSTHQISGDKTLLPVLLSTCHRPPLLFCSLQLLLNLSRNLDKDRVDIVSAFHHRHEYRSDNFGMGS